MIKCDKECFANRQGECMALSEAIKGKCPFQRTDISMSRQDADIIRYGSRSALKDYRVLDGRVKRP